MTDWEFLHPGGGNTGLSVISVPAFSPTVHADVRGGGTQVHLTVIRFESSSRFLRHGLVVGIGKREFACFLFDALFVDTAHTPFTHKDSSCDHRHPYRGSVLAVYQLPADIIERCERDFIQVKQRDIGLITRRQGADKIVKPHRTGSTLVCAGEYFIGCRPVSVFRIGDVVDQPCDLHRGPQVDAVIGQRLIRPKAYVYAGIPNSPKRHDTAAKPEIADRIVHNDRSCLRDRGDIRIIKPNSVNDVAALIENAPVVNILENGPAEP